MNIKKVAFSVLCATAFSSAQNTEAMVNEETPKTVKTKKHFLKNPCEDLVEITKVGIGGGLTLCGIYLAESEKRSNPITSWAGAILAFTGGLPTTYWGIKNIMRKINKEEKKA